MTQRIFERQCYLEKKLIKMEFSSKLVKVHLADYLANLPLPNSFVGIFKLSCKYYFKYFEIQFKFMLNIVI